MISFHRENKIWAIGFVCGAAMTVAVFVMWDTTHPELKPRLWIHAPDVHHSDTMVDYDDNGVELHCSGHMCWCVWPGFKMSEHQAEQVCAEMTAKRKGDEWLSDD